MPPAPLPLLPPLPLLLPLLIPLLLPLGAAVCDVYELGGRRFSMTHHLMKPESWAQFTGHKLYITEAGHYYMVHQTEMMPYLMHVGLQRPRALYGLDRSSDAKHPHVVLTLLGRRPMICEQFTCYLWDPVEQERFVYMRNMWDSGVSDLSTCLNRELFVLDNQTKAVHYVFPPAAPVPVNRHIENAFLFTMDVFYTVYYVTLDMKFFRVQISVQGASPSEPEPEELQLDLAEGDNVTQLVGCGPEYVYAVLKSGGVLQLKVGASAAAAVPRLEGVTSLAVASSGFGFFNASGLYHLRRLTAAECPARRGRQRRALPRRPPGRAAVRPAPPSAVSKQLPLLLSSVGVLLLVVCSLLRALMALCLAGPGAA